MTTQQINNNIAIFCGWSHLENKNTIIIGGSWHGYPPSPGIIKKQPVPDFYNDLNLMREAEIIVVQKDLWPKYLSNLNEQICEDFDEPLNQDPETLWCMVHASANQRSKALNKIITQWNLQNF
jgi:hypothetical protein